MNRETQKQARILGQLVAGTITTAAAAASLGKSIRWVERMRPAFREKGASVLVHGNTGRVPVNAVAPAVRRQIEDLARDKYIGFNFQHLTEMLQDEEEIRASASSVRRVCLAANLSPPRPQKRRSLHRKRRDRRPQEGEMLQLDGTPHDWLEGRGPRMTLINFVDDATGTKWAEFRLGEDLEGYMRVMRGVVSERGKPGSIYTDRTVIVAGASRKYKPFPDEPVGPSQFGRAMEELEVDIILANSPQAKGRVERTHGTDQDRLTSMLRLANACTLEEANIVLVPYLKDFNRRFTVPATNAKPAWRPKPKTNLGDIFCIKEDRTVARDNTVKVYGRIIDIPPGPHKRSYAGERVKVHRRYDGTTGVFLDGVRIGGVPALPKPSRRSASKTVPGKPSSIEQQAVSVVTAAITEIQAEDRLLNPTRHQPHRQNR